MIVIGIDPHMKTDTAVAVDSATGASLGTRTVTGDGAGHEGLLAWARSLGPDRFSRFSGEAAFAMHVGVAPLPVSSGKSCRHRLNRCNNRKLNSAIHMIAVTQARMHPPAIAYMQRKQAEGMSYREALRCRKRLISRVVFKTMFHAERVSSD